MWWQNIFCQVWDVDKAGIDPKRVLWISFFPLCLLFPFQPLSVLNPRDQHWEFSLLGSFQLFPYSPTWTPLLISCRSCAMQETQIFQGSWWFPTDLVTWENSFGFLVLWDVRSHHSFFLGGEAMALFPVKYSKSFLKAAPGKDLPSFPHFFPLWVEQGIKILGLVEKAWKDLWAGKEFPLSIQFSLANQVCSVIHPIFPC